MSAHRLALPLSLRLRRTGSALAGLPASILAITALSRSRRGLARLDDHLLRDIGVTRAEAMAEADCATWNAPSHWRG
jgi:uncharacterized protein YjiS (DUF1127 family)